MIRLEVDNLAKSYRTRSGTIEVLRAASLSLSEPGIVGLVGPNGSGKTTFIRCLAGLVDPDRGRMFLNGDDISGVHASRRQIMALLEGSRSFYWNLTGRENLVYFGALQGLPKYYVDAAIKTFHLDSFADRSAGSYSRGMQQRLALSISCLGSPKVLLLDEPTHGLDREAANQLEGMLRRLAEENEMLILVASHDSSFLQRLAPRVFTISDGRLAEEESSPNRLIRITLSGSLPTNAKLPNCVRYYQEHGSIVLLGRISDASFFVSLGGLMNEGVEISRLEVDGCWGEGWKMENGLGSSNHCIVARTG